jgi:hypothetical protein
MSPPLTVGCLLRDAFAVFAFGFFMSGFAALIAIACFAGGG